RKIEVHVVAPEGHPLERVLGRELGEFIRAIHEEHGVAFHLEETAMAIEGTNVKLKGGATLAADLVVVGIGVRPRLELAERAGLKIDRGVAGEEKLWNRGPRLFCPGGIARWAGRPPGRRARVGSLGG